MKETAACWATSSWKPAMLAILMASYLAFTVLMPSTAAQEPYTIRAHDIVKMEDKNTVPTRRFLPADKAVYLFFEVDWRSVEDCEKTTITQKVYDPDGTITEQKKLPFYIEVLGSGQALKSGAILLFNITATTKLGAWRVQWYEADKLLFTEEFEIASTTAPTTTATTKPPPKTETTKTTAIATTPGTATTSAVETKTTVVTPPTGGPTSETSAIIIIAVVVAAGVGALLLYRRRKPKAYAEATSPTPAI